MPKDYYEALGVQKNASQEEIKLAYKRLAKQHHPDLNKDNKASEEKFKEINEAYRMLGDEKKRQHYDRFGSDERSQAQQSGFEGFEGFEFNMDDLFSSFFGGGFGRSQQRRPRGEDLGISVTITLEEAAAGKRERIAVDCFVACKHCKGTGAESGHRTQCPECKGTGGVRKTQRTPFGVMQTIVTCTECNGVGSVADKHCKECHGAGRMEQEESVTIDIPAGVGDGMQLRVAGKGHAGSPGQHPGDLYVSIHVQEHELFTREGDDLLIMSTITYPQAVLGTTLEVPTLSGSIKVTIQEATESGTVFRARGKGMPNLRGGHGDLLVTVKIAVPKHVSKQERELLEKLMGSEKPKSFFERLKF